MTNSGSERVSAAVRGRTVTAMRAWVNGSLLDDAGRAGDPVTDHGFTVGDGVFEAVKVVDGRPVRADPPPRRGSAAPPAGSGCRSPTWTRSAAASPRCWARSSCRSGRLRITYTGGTAPLGSGRGDDAADPGGRGGAADQAAGDGGGR